MERFRQKYPVSDVYIPSMWAEQALPEYDTAFLVLKSGADMQKACKKGCASGRLLPYAGEGISVDGI